MNQELRPSEDSSEDISESQEATEKISKVVTPEAIQNGDEILLMYLNEHGGDVEETVIPVFDGGDYIIVKGRDGQSFRVEVANIIEINSESTLVQEMLGQLSALNKMLDELKAKLESMDPTKAEELRVEIEMLGKEIATREEMRERS